MLRSWPKSYVLVNSENPAAITSLKVNSKNTRNVHRIFSIKCTEIKNILPFLLLHVSLQMKWNCLLRLIVFTDANSGLLSTCKIVAKSFILNVSSVLYPDLQKIIHTFDLMLVFIVKKKNSQLKRILNIRTIDHGVKGFYKYVRLRNFWHTHKKMTCARYAAYTIYRFVRSFGPLQEKYILAKKSFVPYCKTKLL